jgi:hypothetical protein
MIMSSLDLKFWRAMRSTGVRLSKVSVFTLAVRNISDFTFSINDSKVTFLLGFGTHSLFWQIYSYKRLLSHYQSWPLHFSLPPWLEPKCSLIRRLLAKLSSSSDNLVSLMGPETGQKLRPLESKDVSLSVSWWLERLTTVWELLITRDLRLKCLLCLFSVCQ